MYKLLEPYGKLVEFLGEALGENVEIALHDLTSQEQEIVAISNSHISGREVLNFLIYQFTIWRQNNIKIMIS